MIEMMLDVTPVLDDGILDSQYPAGADMLAPCAETDGIIGTPDIDARSADLQTEGSCALVSAGGVIHAMTGRDISESELVRVATEKGWYNDGTPPEHFGKILDVYDVPYHVVKNASMEDIVAELCQGRKVLIAVDASELRYGDGGFEDWLQERFADIFGVGGDHAVWVTGIDVSDPNDIKVIINDSSDPDGMYGGKVYSLSDFVDAAEDSNFHYVATNEAPPGLDMAQALDPDALHFPGMANYFESRFDAKVSDWARECRGDA